MCYQYAIKYMEITRQISKLFGNTISMHHDSYVVNYVCIGLLIACLFACFLLACSVVLCLFVCVCVSLALVSRSFVPCLRCSITSASLLAVLLAASWFPFKTNRRRRPAKRTTYFLREQLRGWELEVESERSLVCG